MVRSAIRLRDQPYANVSFPYHVLPFDKYFWNDVFYMFISRDTDFGAPSWFLGARQNDFVCVMARSAMRLGDMITAGYKSWISRARTRIAYRPGGAGYLEARRDFMVRAGQSRATRRYNPY